MNVKLLSLMLGLALASPSWAEIKGSAGASHPIFSDRPVIGGNWGPSLASLSDWVSKRSADLSPVHKLFAGIKTPGDWAVASPFIQELDAERAAVLKQNMLDFAALNSRKQAAVLAEISRAMEAVSPKVLKAALAMAGEAAAAGNQFKQSQGQIEPEKLKSELEKAASIASRLRMLRAYHPDIKVLAEKAAANERSLQERYLEALGEAQVRGLEADKPAPEVSVPASGNALSINDVFDRHAGTFMGIPGVNAVLMNFPTSAHEADSLSVSFKNEASFKQALGSGRLPVAGSLDGYKVVYDIAGKLLEPYTHALLFLRPLKKVSDVKAYMARLLPQLGARYGFIIDKSRNLQAEQFIEAPGGVDNVYTVEGWVPDSRLEALSKDKRVRISGQGLDQQTAAPELAAPAPSEPEAADPLSQEDWSQDNVYLGDLARPGAVLGDKTIKLRPGQKLHFKALVGKSQGIGDLVAKPNMVALKSSIVHEPKKEDKPPLWKTSFTIELSPKAKRGQVIEVNTTGNTATRGNPDWDFSFTIEVQ